MGSSASALSTAQSVELTKELRLKYEAYSAHGFSDEEIRTKLIDDYNSIVHKSSTPVAKVGLGKHVVHSKAGSKRIIPSEDSSKGASTKSGKPTRRRSFDGSAAKKLPLPAVVAEGEVKPADHPPLTNQTSDAILNAAEIVVDSWDSVTLQPFCNICQMAFKTESFLQRHIKFSDLHIQNVKKQESVATDDVTKPTDEAVAGTPSTQPELLPAVNKQIEGVHFRLLYTGSKFFWRTQDNVDLHIYHHLLPHSIEVVSYDTAKDREMNRIYLDYTCLWDNARHNYHKASHDQRPLVDEEEKRKVLTTYLLQRLQIDAPSAHAKAIVDSHTKALSTLAFVKLTGDEHDRSPIMAKRPVVLIPVVIARRRRTNAEEIEATITSLADDRKALVEATGNAEKIANLVYSSANQIAGKKWWSGFSKWRKLWIWAIRRVIRQKLVAETRAELEKRDARQKK